MRYLNKKYWPCTVRIDFDDEKIMDAVTWCRENLGNKYRIVGSNTFYFANESDATFFKLAWA
jgi:hypothetical protein